MKIYNVPIYSVKYGPFVHGDIQYVGNIIVKKSFWGVSEILTGYSKIDVVPKEALNDNKLDYHYLNVDCYKENGYHLIVFSNSFVQKNKVLEKELDNYLSSYDNSEWKRIYESMKVLTSKEKSKVNHKVRKIFGTKK